MKLADTHVVSGSIRNGNLFLSPAWSDVIPGGIQSHNAASRAGIVDDIGGGSFHHPPIIGDSSAAPQKRKEFVRFCIIKRSPQLFSTGCFHALVGEMPTHGSQNARNNSHDKTNEYRVKPSRNVGYGRV